MLTAEEIKQRQKEILEERQRLIQKEIIFFKGEFENSLERLLTNDSKVSLAIGEKDIVLNNNQVFPLYVYDDNFRDELVKNGFTVVSSENTITITI